MASPEQTRLVLWLRSQGIKQRDVAERVGLSVRSVQRIYAAHPPDKPEVPATGPGPIGPIQTLLDCLLATRTDGTPDFATRVAAARALLTEQPRNPHAPAAPPPKPTAEGYRTVTVRDSFPGDEVAAA